MFVMAGATPDYEPTAEKSIAAIAARGNRSPQEVAYAYLTERLDNFLFFPIVNYTDGDHETVREMLADPGTLLGLSEAVGGELHKVSVLSVGQTETSYVRRTDLLEFLVKQPRLCMEIVRLLSEDLHCLYQEFRHLQATPGVRVRRRTADGRFQ